MLVRIGRILELLLCGWVCLKLKAGHPKPSTDQSVERQHLSGRDQGDLPKSIMDDTFQDKIKPTTADKFGSCAKPHTPDLTSILSESSLNLR